MLPCYVVHEILKNNCNIIIFFFKRSFYSTTVFVVVVVSDFIYTQNPILSHITNHTTLNFSHAIPAFPNQVHDP